MLHLVTQESDYHSHFNDNHSQKYKGLAHNELLMQEMVIWLVDRAVNPYSKDIYGYTPLHKAASRNNLIVIETLVAATGRSSEYEGCLMQFLSNLDGGDRGLNTAQLLFEVDPDPFDSYEGISGLLPWMFQEITKYSHNPAFGSGFPAFFLKHKEEPNQTKLEFYMSFLEVFLESLPNEIYKIQSWLIIQFFNQRRQSDIAMLGIELWSATVCALSLQALFDEARDARDIIDHRALRQLREMCEQRELFAVRVEQLYGLLLLKAVDGGRLAEMIISQEPAYVRFVFSEDSFIISHDNGPIGWADMLLSLMIHREIHPAIKDEEGEAELLDAIIGGETELFQLLMKNS